MIEVRVVDYLSEEHQQTVSLRNKILREPIGLQYSEQDLEDEKEAQHVACFLDDKLVGACFYIPYKKDTIKLRQMAVDSSIQKQGIGRILIEYVENLAKNEGYTHIYLDARKEALYFYQKLGFQLIGDEFIEVGIPHYEMLKNI